MTPHIVGWQGDKQSAVSASSPMVYKAAGEYLNNIEWYPSPRQLEHLCTKPEAAM